MSQALPNLTRELRAKRTGPPLPRRSISGPVRPVPGVAPILDGWQLLRLTVYRAKLKWPTIRRCHPYAYVVPTASFCQGRCRYHSVPAPSDLSEALTLRQ